MEHLMQVERQTGHTPKELQGPDFPELLGNVWSAFLSLNATRGQGFNGPLPISYTEITNWKLNTGNTLSLWEVDAIIKLDNIFRRVFNA